MKVVTICPVTGRALYISDIKPELLKKGAKGDWGYSTKMEDAVHMGNYLLFACLRDMRALGRAPEVF